MSIAERSDRMAFALDWCPTKIIPLNEQALLFTDGVWRGSLLRADGTEVVPGAVLAAASASNYVLVRNGQLIWNRDSQAHDLGAAGTLRSPAIIAGSGDLLAIATAADGERIVRFTSDGTIDVTPTFAAIDSFDIAPRGDELVFSALRADGFDVAIASPNGKTVNWVPADRADETGVTWAPRGNKVSFLIRRGDSTLVRTVHVPTAFQLTFETPFEAVRALAWEARAERITMILDGPAVSPHIDWIEYSGAHREALVEPDVRSSREPEWISFGEGSALLLPPRTVRYGEALPLFVVLTEEPLAWGVANRDLDSLGGGILRLPASAWNDGAPLAELVSRLRWVDAESVVVISDGHRGGSRPIVAKGQTLVITGMKPAGGLSFAESRLPSGALAVKAENWEGAMRYLRERFQTE